ncbi:hypothetical protein [Myxococcus sp. AB025B]|nr:hypothetical protein [Myxococcus sp. AB025B]
MISRQLNTYKNGGTPGGRPELMLPTDIPGGALQSIPVTLP